MPYNDEIDVERLKLIMKIRNVGFDALAYELGVDRSTVYRKLKAGKSALTLRDYIIIKNCLSLTTAGAKRIFGEI